MTPAWTGLLAVATREVRWILRDRVARFLLFGVPAIAFLLLGFTFSAAVLRGLDVVVVDMDNSATSQLFVQTLAAAPGVSVAQRANDLGGAASAIRAGRAIAAVYLPPEFGKDVLGGRAPRAISFFNTQFFTPGSNAGKSINNALSAATTAVAPAHAVVGDHADAGGPGLVPEEYVLANPALNYAQFLLRAVLPTVLHVVIAISAGLAVGSEFRRRSLRMWWDLAGHNVATALVGKFLPYYVVHMLMFVLMVGILDFWLGVGFRGSSVLMAVSATLLIVAYQMIGCLMQLLARDIAMGLSLTGIIVSPAFGYAGVGFPVLAMGAFPRAWGSVLPLRWYIQILFDQASRGAAVRITAEPFAILSGLTIVLTALVWLGFRVMVRRGLTTPAEAETAPPPPGRGLGGAFAAEWRRMLGDRGVFGLFVIAPVLYAVYYPQPYLGQIVRNVPIAVVDHDNSELARGLVQTLQAHGNIRVALLASSYHEAEDAIFDRRAFAILGIPADTEKNVLKGVTARLPVYADSTYFILFNRALQGVLEAVQAYATDALTHGARPESAAVLAASRLTRPVDLVQVPLFNPTQSYSSYVVPAAFVLILHQTLLMGAAMLGGVAFEQGGGGARAARASLSAILGQGLAHWTIYLPAMLLYFVVMPRIYGFSTLGSVWALAAFSIPFIFATSFLGQALGQAFRHRETAMLLVLATSLPQFFLVGVSWPAEALPAALRQWRELLPSVNAIDGMVRINQMGASLAEVRPDWERLWGLVALYFALAVACAGLRAIGRRRHVVV
ncbi:MAG: type transport system permease protein [Acetobacteraceae bacterium]|nr:type transport system permease protein [Acetobacteraceae bacterium]